jgi:nicotinate-nucleotide adenylyltransferase
MVRSPNGWGVFGGLFDPPHIGHLIIAQHVREEFNLEKIIFIPAGNPPHKTGSAPFIHRLRMIRLAVRGNPDFMVSSVEGGMRGKTYTIDVIKGLKRRCHRPLYLIIGADQWREIQTWKNPRGILQQARLIIVPRPGYPIVRFPSLPTSRIFKSAAPLIDISSTMVRERIGFKRSVRYLIPDPVNRYIMNHGLHRIWTRAHK